MRPSSLILVLSENERLGVEEAKEIKKVKTKNPRNL